MPPKKKSKPSFKVPEELESAPQAGWVYRSEPTPTAEKKSSAAVEAAQADSAEKELAAAARKEEPVKTPATRTSGDHEPRVPPTSPRIEPARSSSSSILDLTAKTFSSGMATLGNAFKLGAALLTAPLRMGLWLVGIRGRD
jgi:hypothetical protein